MDQRTSGDQPVKKPKSVTKLSFSCICIRVPGTPFVRCTYVYVHQGLRIKSTCLFR